MLLFFRFILFVGMLVCFALSIYYAHEWQYDLETNYNCPGVCAYAGIDYNCELCSPNTCCANRGTIDCVYGCVPANGQPSTKQIKYGNYAGALIGVSVFCGILYCITGKKRTTGEYKPLVSHA